MTKSVLFRSSLGPLRVDAYIDQNQFEVLLIESAETGSTIKFYQLPTADRKNLVRELQEWVDYCHSQEEELHPADGEFGDQYALWIGSLYR